MCANSNGSRRSDATVTTADLGDRREIRYTIPIEIEVSGIQASGRVFRERVFTRNVSQSGCSFLLALELKTNDFISLQVFSSGTRESEEARQSLFQIVRVSKEGSYWLVGAWKMDAADVWNSDLEKAAKQQGGVDEPRTIQTPRTEKWREKES